jgi:WD40 repeat protein
MNPAKPPVIYSRLGPFRRVRCLAMTPDGQSLACGCGDNHAYVWRLGSDGESAVLLGCFDASPYTGSLGDIRAVGLSLRHDLLTLLPRPDVLRLVGSNGSTVALSLPSGKVLSRHWVPDPPEGAQPDLPFIQLVRSGQQLLLGNSAGQVRCIDFVDGRERWTWRLPLHGARLDEASLSPEGSLLATGDDRGIVRLLEVRSRQVIAAATGRLTYWSQGSQGADFAADGSRFVCQGGDPFTLLVWSRGGRGGDPGRGFRRITLPKRVIESHYALSPDGSLLALSYQGTYAEVWVWDLDARGQVRPRLFTFGKLPQPDDNGHATICMRFSPDGRALVMGIRDGSVVVWRFREGKHVTFDPFGRC